MVFMTHSHEPCLLLAICAHDSSQPRKTNHIKSIPKPSRRRDEWQDTTCSVIITTNHDENPPCVTYYRYYYYRYEAVALSSPRPGFPLFLNISVHLDRALDCCDEVVPKPRKQAGNWDGKGGCLFHFPLSHMAE